MNRIPKIFILDDNETFLKLTSNILIKGMKCEVYTFTSSKEMFLYKYLQDADLFIIDIMLQEETGFEVLDKLSKTGSFNPPPILFISGFGDLIDFDEFKKREFKGIFDYMSKPINSDSLLNKISLLLKVSVYQKQQTIIQKNYDTALWNMLYYSNFYFLVLNCDLEIKRINNKLGNILGIEENKSINKSILKYTTEDYTHIIPNICDTLIGAENKYIEFVFDVKTSDNKIISVKWFVTFVNEGRNYLLCIGIPLLEKTNTVEDIDSLRQYYKTMVDKDTIMIKALKKKLDAESNNISYNVSCNNLQPLVANGI
jgi:FixJ family two-component response regulator